MTETNLTLGTWAVYGDWGIKDSSGRLIAKYEPLCSDIDLGNKDESFANAHLIAAAPELYELVDLVFKSIDGGGNVVTFSDDVYDEMRDALAKARGES